MAVLFKKVICTFIRHRLFFGLGKYKLVDILRRIITLRFLVTFAFSFCCCYVFPQGSASNQGKEFWTAYMSHVEDNGQSQMSLYIASDANTSGKVEIADGSFPAILFTVKAKEITIVTIPRIAFIKNNGQFLKGIHITALKKIAVFAHIYAQSVSGATLLLPVGGLGKSYSSINYIQASNANVSSYSDFAVVATEDNTTVEITPSNNLIGGQSKNEPFLIQLKKGEVYQGFSSNDLTATRIRSVSTSTGECKKIAVFSGSTKIGIGCSAQGNNFSSDNLFQQVYPTSSWGKSYITTPLKGRNYDIFRVVLSDLHTVVKVNGQVVMDGINQNNQTYYQFNSQQPNIITADKPIQVAQYAVTQGNHIQNDCAVEPNDLGDPEMIYLSPLEQTLDHVTLYSASAFAIQINFINVVIKTSSVPTFSLDDKLYSDFTPIPGQEDYSYAQISVPSGAHYLNASGGFNAIAYGFGNRESYGYAAGTNLQNLNEFIVIKDKQSNQSTVNGCAGVEYKLQITIPYQTSNIKWDFNDGTPQYIDNSPVVIATTQRDSKTLYTYEYYKVLAFNPGEYSITSTVHNPTADECGSDALIDFDFSIADFPESKYTVSGYCSGDTTLFSDKSDPKTSSIKSWLWDFGDGQTSVLQNPKHVYVSGGSYIAKLTVTNEGGCTSISNSTINILDKPTAAFKLPAPYCFGKSITITDQSTSASGAIKQWIWNFGDGTAAETHTDNKPFTHVFAKSGADTIQLTVVTEHGCSAIIQKVIDLKPAPVVDFSLPDICLADAVAKFRDKSTIADNSENAFTYLWNFGDANANAGNPNTSALKEPTHKYTKADNYIVTLTITAASGCAITKTQTLTVNGDIPAALFVIENKDHLCSASPVAFKDLSTVNFGNVTKVVWYYDYENKPNISEVFNKADIPADRIYHHNYDVFNSPLTKKFTVRMEAYSGETCVDVTQQTIIVNANPLVSLTQVGTVCYGASPLQVIADNKGFAGNGVFSGKGITLGGMFTPGVAGAGVSTITYTFRATNGCEYTTTQNITVYDELKASAGSDIILLEGESTTLKGTSNKADVTYKWRPSIGLDHDDVASPVATPIEDITYNLTITNANGCTNVDDVFVHVLKRPVVVTAFTPNNDGINDIWNVKYLESYPGNIVDIYNREGEKVYSSVGYAIPWDGRYRGRELPAGTYYYIISPKNGRKVISGNVTIIR
jgi:gliding motility-associated-like protein